MIQHITHTRLFRAIAVMVIVAFVSLIPAQSGYAQVVVQMPAPGQMIHPTGAFEPALMAGMRVDIKDPFNFYFIMDKGEKAMSNDVKKTEYEKLIKYFLASLTIANDDMWVNLSPHESNRIIPDNFAQTSMGRDLLAQDYILKQFTASLMYPEDKIGRSFWDKIYAQAYERYGTTDIPVDTFNKVWITADQADIYQKDDTAFLVKSHLKVMLEQDLMAMEQNTEQFGSGIVPVASESDEARKIASDIVREVIIPVIEKEVNEGENFAQVRQIYASMIMATWFKKTLKESLLGQAYADKDKVQGIEVDDPKAKEKIYQQYVEAYKTGVFNYIKEEVDTATNEMIPRKYFSGGLTAVSDKAMRNADPVEAGLKAKGMLEKGTLDAAQTSLEVLKNRFKMFVTRKVTGITLMMALALFSTGGLLAENVSHRAVKILGEIESFQGVVAEIRYQRAGVLAIEKVDGITKGSQELFLQTLGAQEAVDTKILELLKELLALKDENVPDPDSLAAFGEKMADQLDGTVSPEDSLAAVKKAGEEAIAKNPGAPAGVVQQIMEEVKIDQGLSDEGATDAPANEDTISIERDDALKTQQAELEKELMKELAEAQIQLYQHENELAVALSKLAEVNDKIEGFKSKQSAVKDSTDEKGVSLAKIVAFLLGVAAMIAAVLKKGGVKKKISQAQARVAQSAAKVAGLKGQMAKSLSAPGRTKSSAVLTQPVERAISVLLDIVSRDVFNQGGKITNQKLDEILKKVSGSRDKNKAAFRAFQKLSVAERITALEDYIAVRTKQIESGIVDKGAKDDLNGQIRKAATWLAQMKASNPSIAAAIEAQKPQGQAPVENASPKQQPVAEAVDASEVPEENVVPQAVVSDVKSVEGVSPELTDEVKYLVWNANAEEHEMRKANFEKLPIAMQISILKAAMAEGSVERFSLKEWLDQKISYVVGSVVVNLGRIEQISEQDKSLLDDKDVQLLAYFEVFNGLSQEEKIAGIEKSIFWNEQFYDSMKGTSVGKETKLQLDREKSWLKEEKARQSVVSPASAPEQVAVAQELMEEAKYLVRGANEKYAMRKANFEKLPIAMQISILKAAMADGSVEKFGLKQWLDQKISYVVGSVVVNLGRIEQISEQDKSLLDDKDVQLLAYFEVFNGLSQEEKIAGIKKSIFWNEDFYKNMKGTPVGKATKIQLDREKAWLAANDKAEKSDVVGGIDLGDEHLNINIKVDGQGMPLAIQFQDPVMTDMQGLSPIIREIAPVSPANIPVISELIKMAGNAAA